VKLSLRDIEGRWHILASNFPMWKDGSRKNPSFLYTILQRNGKTLLRDQVQFYRNERLKTIEGSDAADDESNTSFTWRGKGLLALFKSRWSIAWINDEKDLAVIRFSKTLLTPEGFDIISRNKNVPAEAVQPAISFLSPGEKAAMFPVAQA